MWGIDEVEFSAKESKILTRICSAYCLRQWMAHRIALLIA